MTVIAATAGRSDLKTVPANASQRSATVMTAEISWNYTTWLNVIFLVIAAALVVRFITSGGLPMLRMMGGSPDAPHDHHDRHDDHLGH